MTDLDRYQYVYGFNSNRLSKANTVSAANSVYLDEMYSYDALNRLTLMQRGQLSGGVIASTPVREMDYTLDPTGNWSAYLTKTSGATDLNQTRTSNAVNEVTAITAMGGTPGWATPPAYDPAGNMTGFPKPAAPTTGFTTTYDAWNRMTSLSNVSGGSAVATYQYDGRGRRIVKTTPSETRHFYYTNNWQDIEERTGASTSMDKQYVWGRRYVDELVCRDDANNLTTPRLYGMHDANFNLTSVCDSSGTVQERYLFDPYGTPTIMNASWGNITSSAYGWVIGHQGLMQDGESGLVYNRRRTLHPILGTFMARDPIGYRARTMNLYQYCFSNAIRFVDPFGLDVDCKTATTCYADCITFFDTCKRSSDVTYSNLTGSINAKGNEACQDVLTQCLNNCKTNGWTNNSGCVLGTTAPPSTPPASTPSSDDETPGKIAAKDLAGKVVGEGGAEVAPSVAGEEGGKILGPAATVAGAVDAAPTIAQIIISSAASIYFKNHFTDPSVATCDPDFVYVVVTTAKSSDLPGVIQTLQQGSNLVPNAG